MGGLGKTLMGSNLFFGKPAWKIIAMQSNNIKMTDIFHVPHSTSSPERKEKLFQLIKKVMQADIFIPSFRPYNLSQCHKDKT